MWRENTGLAYGYSQVKHASALLRIGKFEQAMQAFKKMQPTQYGIPGRPDIMGILLATGRGLAIEVKMPGQDLTDEQKAWRGMWERFNGLYILAYSIQDVFNGLSSVGATL